MSEVNTTHHTDIARFLISFSRELNDLAKRNKGGKLTTYDVRVAMGLAYDQYQREFSKEGAAELAHAVLQFTSFIK